MHFLPQEHLGTSKSLPSSVTGGSQKPGLLLWVQKTKGAQAGPVLYEADLFQQYTELVTGRSVCEQCLKTVCSCPERQPKPPGRRVQSA